VSAFDLDDRGLDDCEARSWHGWHKHMSLVMAAATFLSKLSAEQRLRQTGHNESGTPRRPALALSGVWSMPEIRSLIAKLLLPARAGPAFIWAWSHWRRAHRFTAAIFSRRQSNTQP